MAQVKINKSEYFILILNKDMRNFQAIIFEGFWDMCIGVPPGLIREDMAFISIFPPLTVGLCSNLLKNVSFQTLFEDLV